MAREREDVWSIEERKSVTEPNNYYFHYMKPIALLIMCFLLNSCATIYNSKYKTVKIHTTLPSIIKYDSLELHTKNNKLTLDLVRSKHPAKLTIVSDSGTKEVFIKPYNSSAFYANLFYLCVGFVVDRNNPKRYTYPTTIHVNSTDTSNTYFRFISPGKGQWLLHASIPYGNIYYFVPSGQSSAFGYSYYGLSLGLDHYHRKGQFLELAASATTGWPFPFPAPVRFDGAFDFMRTQYASLTNNHKVWRLSIGYGLCLGQNIWTRRYYNTTPTTIYQPPMRRTHTVAGMVFPLYYQATQRFRMGVIYRPTILRPTLSSYSRYEHLMSLDLAWKIGLNKPVKTAIY
jgi:hypothetical protein